MSWTKALIATAGAAGVAGILAGCGADPAADPCARRLRAIDARLEAAAQMTEPSGAPPAVALPIAAGVPLEGAPPLIVIADGEVTLAGRGVGGGEDLERLADTVAHDLASLASASHRTEGEPWPIAVWAQPELSAHQLARILSRAPDEARFVLLVRGEPSSRPRVPHAPRWVARALAGSDTDDPLSRRDRLDSTWSRAVRTCPAAQAHLPIPARLSPTGPPLGPPSLARLSAALRQCGCRGTDLAAIEAVATAALVSEEGPLRRAPPDLRFGPSTGPGEELVLAPDADVAALAARLAPMRGSDAPMWIRVD